MQFCFKEYNIFVKVLVTSETFFSRALYVWCFNAYVWHLLVWDFFLKVTFLQKCLIFSEIFISLYMFLLFTAWWSYTTRVGVEAYPELYELLCRTSEIEWSRGYSNRCMYYFSTFGLDRLFIVCVKTDRWFCNSFKLESVSKSCLYFKAKVEFLDQGDRISLGV